MKSPPFALALALSGLVFACDDDSSPNQPQAPVTTGIPRSCLVAEYLLDGDGANSVACAFGEAAIGGSPLFVENRFGKSEKACRFDSMDDQIVAVEDDYACGHAVSVSLWFCPAEFPSNYDVHLFARCSDFAVGCWQSILLFGVGTEFISVDTLTVVDEWHHLVATYDGVTARAYVDGMLQKEAAADPPSVDPDIPLTFGQVEWKGVLDDVRIYNRAIADLGEVQALYREGGYAP